MRYRGRMTLAMLSALALLPLATGTKAHVALAAAQNVSRIEIPVEGPSDVRFLIPTEAGELLLFWTEHRGGGQRLVVQRYDQALSLTSTHSADLPEKVEFQGTESASGKAWVLFDHAKVKILALAQIDAGTGQTVVANLRKPAKYNGTGVVAAGEKLLINGGTKGCVQPLLVEASSSDAVPVKGADGGADCRSSVRACPGHACAYVVHQGDPDAGTFWSVTRSRNGGPGESFTFTDKTGLQPTTLAMVDLQTVGTILVGAYAGEDTSQTVGLFLAKAAPEVMVLRRTPFSSQEGYVADLSGRRYKKAVKKKQRKLDQGEEYVRKDLTVVCHPPIVSGNEIIVVVELSRAIFHTVHSPGTYQRLPHGGGYRTPGTYYRVFDGWQATSALVTSFSQKGEILWDQFLPIQSSLAKTLERRVRAKTDGDRILLSYSDGSSIVVKEIVGGKATGESESTRLPEGRPGDVVKDTVPLGFDHWYQDYFISWSIEKIKNKADEAAEKKRWALVVNKIKLGA